MPYSYPNNIPATIENLPVGAQKIWISTFNSVVDNGGDEDSARQAAWVQVKSKYKKDKQGNWVKKKLNGDENMSDKIIKKEIINDTDDKGFFKAFIPLQQKNGKVEILTKNVDGKKIKFLRGVASNTQVDKEDDFMSKEFIEKMKGNVLGLTVFAEHKHEIEKTLGYVEDVGGDEDNMIVDTALEDEENNPLVEKILQKIDHGIQIGYSIGGKLTKAVKEFNEAAGKTVRKILDGEIYEVSVTAMPAGNDTWVSPITKSFNKWLDFVEDENNENLKKSLESDKEKNTPKKSNKDTKSESKSSENETTPNDEVSKILDEIIESDEIQSKIYDLLWAFRTAISSIIYDDEMEPAQKKEKIVALGTEFGLKIEALSSQLADIVAQISEQLNS